MGDYSFWLAVVQFTLAVLLFFIINKLGEKSVSIGYMELSMTLPEETSPVFNFLFKAVAPVIFQILVIAVFEALGLNGLTYMSFMIIVYYWCFRLFVVLVLGKGRMTDWLVQFIYIVTSIGLSVVVYRVATKAGNLLPDPSTLRDELWILVILFLYQIFNKMTFRQEKSRVRHERYIKTMYSKFQIKYNDLLVEKCDDELVRKIVYSIMIYENYNRPPFARFFENLCMRIDKKGRTLGIMQVKTSKLISNEESIILAIDIIKKNIMDVLDCYDADHLASWHFYEVANKYNPGDPNYGYQVAEIYRVLFDDSIGQSVPT